MKSGNPVLTEKTFGRLGELAVADEVMSIDGTMNKIAILFACVVAPAAYVWGMGPQTATLAMIVGGLGGFIFCLVTVFKQEWSPVTAPIYALFEGLFVGGASTTFESMFPGIVFQAVLLTFGTFLVMLVAFKTSLIKVTEQFKAGLVAATGAICLIYLVSVILGLFGVRVPYIHEGGYIGIGFSLVVVVIAALNLVLDFDFIDQGAREGLPKYMEWYGAFGLMVTLIWLYIEMLRLLMKIRTLTSGED